MSKRTATTVEVAGKELTVTNLDKVLWPADGYTKGDLIAYYRSVAAYLLPHIAGRPLTLQRYPDGIDGPSFFEKNVPRGTPPWVGTVTLSSEYGSRDHVEYVVCDDEPTLVWIANLASIVLHPWTSRLPNVEKPDMLLFDLDPGSGCGVARLAHVALAFQDALGEIGLNAQVKTTGGSGLHVVVPLQTRYGYDVAKQFAELVARRVHAVEPETTTIERATARRPQDAVYLDYVQVGRGKTMVAPYSVRARAGAPVSMPLTWDEVAAMARKRGKDTEAENGRFTIANVARSLARDGDAWDERSPRGQRLEAALAAAQRLWRT